MLEGFGKRREELSNTQSSTQREVKCAEGVETRNVNSDEFEKSFYVTLKIFP